MKKILKFLTGIVFILAILVACSYSEAVTPLEEGPKKVTIHVKAVKIDGKKHLEMYDSNKPELIVIDTLETVVNPGDTVVWKIDYGWRIRKIEKIGPQNPGNIFNRDAELIPGTRDFRIIIPEDAQAGREKYDIYSKGWLMSPWGIDPYLKLPEQP